MTIDDLDIPTLLPKRKPHPRRTGVDHLVRWVNVVTESKQGLSQKELSEKFGLEQTSISRILRNFEITHDDVKMMVALYNDGLHTHDIADKFDITEKQAELLIEHYRKQSAN